MKVARIAVCFILGVMTILLPCTSLAQGETIKLEATYPRVESAPPKPSFEFVVALTYHGGQGLNFDLKLTTPTGWITYITPANQSTRVSVIKLEPASPESIKVIAAPPESDLPEPREYRITLEASSDGVKGSIELIAVVKPTYSLDFVTSPT